MVMRTGCYWAEGWSVNDATFNRMPIPGKLRMVHSPPPKVNPPGPPLDPFKAQCETRERDGVAGEA